MTDNDFFYVAWMLYTIVAVGVTAFLVTILPSLLVSAYDAIWKWTDVLLIELREHFQFLREEKSGRHRVDDFFGSALFEMREVSAGRRMPVSING